jgi:uncharacterized protein YecT (DUF1311 family)
MAQAAGNHMTATPEQCRDGLRDASIAEAAAYCASLELQSAERDRTPRLAALTQGWSQSDKNAYATFRSVRSTFLESEKRHAVLRIAPQRPIYAEIEELDDEVALMVAFGTGEGPTATAADLAKADQDLNTLYRRLLTGPEVTRQDWGLTEAGLRASQRAWLAYRDAWLNFARLKWPTANVQGLATHLTVRRSTTLVCLLADMDAGPDYETRCTAPAAP